MRLTIPTLLAACLAGQSAAAPAISETGAAEKREAGFFKTYPNEAAFKQGSHLRDALSKSGRHPRTPIITVLNKGDVPMWLWAETNNQKLSGQLIRL
jgi:hypothetical protein